MSGTRNTRDFLNLLRVVGRMWGSHGDKITAASKGRNVDDEKADRLRGGRAPPGLDPSPSRGGAESPSPWGDVVMSSTSSPAILRQRSVEGGLLGGGMSSSGGTTHHGGGGGGSTTTNTNTSGPGNPTGGGPASVILRQVSRDLVSPSPVMAQLPVTVLRQVSREFTNAVGPGLSKTSTSATATHHHREAAPPAGTFLQRQQQQSTAELFAFPHKTNGAAPSSTTTAAAPGAAPRRLPVPTTTDMVTIGGRRTHGPSATDAAPLWVPGRFIGLASSMLFRSAAEKRAGPPKPYMSPSPPSSVTATRPSITGA